MRACIKDGNLIISASTQRRFCSQRLQTVTIARVKKSCAARYAGGIITAGKKMPRRCKKHENLSEMGSSVVCDHPDSEQLRGCGRRGASHAMGSDGNLRECGRMAGGL